ncbi:MAG: hypothetical protein K0R39_1699 [Symbiobacteriaceae bacterium]|jgi:ABC-type glycerol-3-phosphate transport system substrate-binding protein|nr:hypothetical protein [Symbiobacteriaceae bacterium]
MKNLVRVVLALFLVAVAAGCGPKSGGPGAASAGEGESPIFNIDTVVGGKTVKKPIRGEEGKFGFEDAPFVSGQQDKYIWHFWNNADLPGQKMNITAENQTTKEKIDLARVTLSTGTNGASATATSLLLIPKPGLWRLDVSFNDQLFGSITVRVK